MAIMNGPGLSLIWVSLQYMNILLMAYLAFISEMIRMMMIIVIILVVIIIIIISHECKFVCFLNSGVL